MAKAQTEGSGLSDLVLGALFTVDVAKSSIRLKAALDARESSQLRLKEQLNGASGPVTMLRNDYLGAVVEFLGSY